MSRIGRKPVPIPKGVKVEVQNGSVKVASGKGELTIPIHPHVSVEVKNDQVVVARQSDEKEDRSLHGLFRALIANMIKGVTAGFNRKLELVGVGYRAELKGRVLQLALGYSHPIVFRAPAGIKIETPTQTNITISGIDKQLVGLVAAKIRSLRPPEPYKGKGIKYEGEYVRRKAGKTAASAAK